jgi:uncharacterized protein
MVNGIAGVWRSYVLLPTVARQLTATRLEGGELRPRRPHLISCVGWQLPLPTAPLMRPQLSVLTLGVDDLDRAVAFYEEGLGFATEGIIGREFEHGAVAFFDLQPGLRLALWPRASLAKDAGIRETPPSATEMTLGHNVSSRAEVDATMAVAERAGARIVKAAEDTFWGGYAGYFADPDGHLWEVVWNPAWQASE